MKRFSRGAALMEFALAWPIVLLLVLGCVELAVWESEATAARNAALAGARAGTVAGANPEVAVAVTLQALAASVIGVSPSEWCMRDAKRSPTLWVCATDLGGALQLDVGGSVPALVPLLPGRGLPIRAHIVLNKERFVP